MTAENLGKKNSDIILANINRNISLYFNIPTLCKETMNGAQELLLSAYVFDVAESFCEVCTEQYKLSKQTTARGM